MVGEGTMTRSDLCFSSYVGSKQKRKDILGRETNSEVVAVVYDLIKLEVMRA